MALITADQLLWKPHGTTEEEILEEWPYTFQMMLTKPIGFPATMALLAYAERTIRDPPVIKSIIRLIRTHITAHLQEHGPKPMEITSSTQTQE